MQKETGSVQKSGPEKNTDKNDCKTDEHQVAKLPGATEETAIIEFQGAVAQASELKDKAIVIENGVGMDTIFALISADLPEDEIAGSIGLSKSEFTLLVRSNSSYRQRYLKAKNFRIADKSADKLNQFADYATLEKPEEAAAKMHDKNMARALKSYDEGQSQAGIIINNTLIVRDRNEIPELPEGLSEVIDVTPDAPTDS